MAEEKPIVVYAAVAANAAIAVVKYGAAMVSGSSAMLAEAIHSTVDTANELLLLLGLRRSRRPADSDHPFGHGKELYFWSLIVAIGIFGIGGGMSIYEGITHLAHPEKIEKAWVNFAVLGFAFLFEGTSWTLAMRKILKERREGESVFHTVRGSKDPSVYTVVGEDTAALLGILVAAAGVGLGVYFDSPFPDAIASIAIGLILAAVAVFLAKETRGLLVGEAADRETVEMIHRVVGADPAVEKVGKALTMHLAPGEILLNLEIQFRPGIEGLTGVINRIETAIRREEPRIQRIYLEARCLGRDQRG